MKDKDKNVTAVLIEIAQQYGTDIFRQEHKVYALLTDLAPGDMQAKERRRIRSAFESGAVEVLMKSVDENVCSELYFNESVTKLISQTDMDGQLARETMLSLARALSVLPEENKPNAERTHSTAVHKSGNNISDTVSDIAYFVRSHIGAVIAVAAALLAAAAVVIGIFMSDKTVGQWFIGIGSGVALVDAAVVLSFILENTIYNEKCQTISFAIPVVIIADIAVKLVLGAESFGIIFRIILVFAFVAAIVNTVLTRTELEEKFTAPNIIYAALCVFVFFDYPWDVWQWIIGIGGGLALCALSVLLSWALETVGPEVYHTLSVLLILFTLANLVLLVLQGENCLIISMCLLLILGVGALITAFMAFADYSTGLGAVDIVLAIINGGVFLFIILGSYETLMSYIQPVLDIIR